jgi:hypothetical protein
MNEANIAVAPVEADAARLAELWGPCPESVPSVRDSR